MRTIASAVALYFTIVSYIRRIPMPSVGLHNMPHPIYNSHILQTADSNLARLYVSP